MTTKVRSIPRPLVLTNQWFIVISVILTWTSGQTWILSLPLIAGIMGLLFGFNPVMRLAKVFLKKSPSEYIPEEWDQQQFNQAIAVTCLTLGLVSYTIGWQVLGIIFTAMVALAAFVAILGFCIGCYIRFQLKQYRYRKSLN